MFADDNVIGPRPKAKALLRFLRDDRDAHGYRFKFGTEASLNLAEDTELLELFRDACFGWALLGIETRDPDGLRKAHGAGKLRGDWLAGVRSFYRYGIDVLGGFLIGFDNDTMRAFDAQYRFIDEAGIQVSMSGLLTSM